MTRVVRFPHVTFKNITNEVKHQTKNNQQGFEVWQCWHVGTYIGLIAWSDDNKQYCFYPMTQTQAVLNATALEDIHEKIWSLMKDRVLN